MRVWVDGPEQPVAMTCSFFLEENRHGGGRFYILHGFGFAAKAVRRLCAFLSITGPWNDGEQDQNKGKHTPPRWWRLNLPHFLKKKRNSLCSQSIVLGNWKHQGSWGGDCKIEWGKVEAKSRRLEIGHKSVMVRISYGTSLIKL